MFFFTSDLPKSFFVAVVCVFFLWPTGVFCADFDSDGLSDADETNLYHTDPYFADTDGDSINDATEVAFWRNNWNVDSDGDGLIGLLDYDSDNDGFSDGEEMTAGSNPGNAKSIPIEPPLFSIHKLVVGLGFHKEYEGWVDVMGGGYAHERWLQVNWADFNTTGGATRIASGDIDGDGKDEIIIGLGPVAGAPSIPGGVFEVLDDDFTHLAWGEVGWSDYNQANGESQPATGDIDGDGKDEIVLGLGTGGEARFEALKLSEDSILHLNWGEIDWQDYADLYGETHPATADVDFDGKNEIVVGLGKGGDGWIDILDDASKNYTLLKSVQAGLVEYGQTSGETWPAVRFARTLSDKDSDQDGLTDEEEAMLGLFSDSSDTDGDGFSDSVELGYGTDPLNKSSWPGFEDRSTPTTASDESTSSGVTLAWDPNIEGDLAGYRVYYGSRSGNYEANIDVGNQTTYTLTNLTPEKIYYFSAKAYNTANQESAFSEEISHFYNPSGKTVAIAPSGSITNNIPAFSWYAVPGASQYYLGAKDSVAIKILKVYTAEASGCASGEAICAITPQMALVNGPCKWAVRPQNSSDDYGAWSDIISFSIN